MTDNGGKSSAATVDIRVIKTNQLPEITDIRVVTSQPVAGGAEVSVEATATDPDGTIDTYDWNPPRDANNNPIGRFVDEGANPATWIAPAEEETEQTYTIGLRVFDNRSGGTNGTVDVRVRAANKEPIVTIGTGTKTVGGGSEVGIEATARDDDGTITSYAWTATNAAGTDAGSFDPPNPNPANPPNTTWTAPAKTDSEQRITLRLTATDNEGATDYAEVLMKVSGNDQPTAEITTAEQDVAGGAVVALNATATDDDDTVLTYAWTANPNVGVFSDAAILEPSWTAPAKEIDEQEVTLTLSVSDGTSTSTAEVTITVLANQAPSIDGITTTPAMVDGELEVSGGAQVTLQATAD